MKTESIAERMIRSVRSDQRLRSSRILAAVSGGADSVALLRLLISAGVEVEAAHCNFGLRGEESERDMAFVEDLCENLSVKLHRIRFDAARTARERGISIEMACRELRYEWFAELLRRYGFRRVAVAHNYDDNLETMLLNMIRGCGTEGMRGMPSDNGLAVRPLLEFTRSEIEKYLQEIGQDFITDSSNLSSEYNRNFIRLELIPLIERRWPGARKSLGLTRRNLERESAVCQNAIQQALGDDAFFLRRETITGFADAPTLIHAFLGKIGHNPYIENEICRALESDPDRPRVWHLSGKEIHLTRQGVLITQKAEFKLPECKWSLIRLESPAADTGRECLLPHPEEYYEWRPPRPGERIKLLGSRGSVLLSKALKEGGVAPRLRPVYPVLARKNGGDAVWVPGVKRCGIELVTNGASTAYRVALKKEIKKS